MHQIGKAILVVLFLFGLANTAASESISSAHVEIIASGLNKPYGLFLKRMGIC